MVRFAFLVFLTGCCTTSECMEELYGITPITYGGGGGQDVVSVNLPFDAGFTATCMQGVGGSYSHHYDSTYYDVDLDTPNDEDVPVYAPVDGVAYVHDADRNHNFGVHTNIDLGDGTYIVLAHMDDVFVDDGSEVAAGELLGFEGTTGASTGDHVHIGRHDGDPAKDAIYGDSIEGLTFFMDDGGDSVELLTSDMTCAMSGGGRYTSLLATPRWRPNGSLVMTPYASTVYALENFTLRPFTTEGAFVSRNYDFGDVALISSEEAACYATGDAISGDSQVQATYDGDGVWLLVGAWEEASRYRMLVPSQGWQGVLKTWGIQAATYDDLESNDDLGDIVAHYPLLSSAANYRDGSLVSTIESSAVYVMSDGAALPIDRWETLLVLGWEDRDVVEVSDAEFKNVASIRGNCGTDSYCVSKSDVVTCGGPHESGDGVYPAEGTGDTGEGSAASDDGGSDDTASTDATGLQIVWLTPSGMIADSISLSGEFTNESGYAYGWNQNIVTTYTAGSIVFDIDDAGPGDSFRYSLEYTYKGSTMWSCTGPFPPGTVTGRPSASYNGAALTVATVDDPGSDGCGLQVTIPK